ncbi:MAG: hypothetical protein ACE5NG_06085 [bacterium]
MTFGKYFTQWGITTVVFGVLAFLCSRWAPTHTLWPFALSFLYVGVLILLTGKMFIDTMAKKE